MAKMFINRTLKSDIYQLGLDEGLVKGLTETAAKVTTLNQATMFRKNIGKLLSAEFRKPDINKARVDMLEDAYATMTRIEERAIIDSAMLLGPKTGAKAGKEAVKILREAKASYVQFHKQYGPLAESAGLKAKSPQVLLDILEEVPSEKLHKLLDLNDFNSAKALKKSHPEIFNIARQQKLNDFKAKITDNKGVVSFDKFLTKAKALTPEQRQILFGFDRASQQKFNDLMKLAGSVPKNINPSGTSVNLSFMDLINPVFQGKEMVRYALYRGGDAAMQKLFAKTLPAMQGIESSANSVKNQVVTASNGFVRSLAPAATIATLSRPSEESLRDTEKTYKIIQENPEKFVEDYMTKNRDLVDAAPNTGHALQQKVIAAAQFLQSKIPKTDDGYIAQQRSPSRLELTQFGEYVEAVESPKKVLQNVAKGYVSPAQMEALKAVYPKIYAALQAEVLNRMPKNLNRAQKTQLQLLIGAKVNPSMSVNGFSILQGKTGAAVEHSSKVSQMQASVVKPTATGLSKLESASREQGSLDKVLNRRA
jgi:hypothetical protein